MDSFAGNNFDPLGLHKYGYANEDPIIGCDPTGEFSIIDLSTAGLLRMLVITTVLITVALTLRSIKILSGSEPSESQKRMLATAVQYLHAHAGQQFQEYVSIVDNTMYRVVPNNPRFNAKTAQPKVFENVVQVTPNALDWSDKFLAATLLHEAVHWETGFFSSDETQPHQVESDFLRSIGVEDTSENLKRQYTAIPDQIYIDTEKLNFHDANVQSPAIR